MKRNTREIISSYLYILPAITILGIFFIAAIVWSFGLSFSDFTILKIPQFIGIENYRQQFQDPIFFKSVYNTLIFTISTVIFGVAIALILALLVRIRSGISSFSRAIAFLPVMISWVAASLVWKWLYHPTFSLINHYLSYLGVNPIDWIGSPKYALISIIIMSLWKEVGYNMVLFIAGLESIPKELLEAASIDGVGGMRRFLFITFPLLRPITAFVICVTAIYGFQMFTQSYVLTAGGPNYSSISTVQYIYMSAFKFLKMGYASAISVLLFMLIMGVTLAQLKLLERKY